jgi:serine/threonine protein kinase
MGNEPSTVSYDPEDRFHEAIAAFEQARDEGRNPDPAKWLDDYPDLAARLAAYFKTQQEIERRAGLLLPSIPGYEILAALKEGGMGVVYRARQVALDRPAAVKMIREELLTDAGIRERFRVEAKAVARLDHPNIVRVYESGEADGRPYFALEFVAGGSLAEWRRPGA